MGEYKLGQIVYAFDFDEAAKNKIYYYLSKCVVMDTPTFNHRGYYTLEIEKTFLIRGRWPNKKGFKVYTSSSKIYNTYSNAARKLIKNFFSKEEK